MVFHPRTEVFGVDVRPPMVNLGDSYSGEEKVGLVSVGAVTGGLSTVCFVYLSS